MNYATYSPEDNKLRLYVGRVSRPEYDFALRQYLFDLDKKSPWKNPEAPVKSDITFSAA